MEEVDGLRWNANGLIIEVAFLQYLRVVLPLSVGNIHFKPVLVRVEVDVFEDVKIMQEQDDLDDGGAEVVGLRQRVFEFFYGERVFLLEWLCS